jgi:aminoglycoside/choline kinase family phosphotransferase
MPDRSAIIDTFLAGNGWGEATREALAGDASFRRYIRLRRGDDTAMLMDAPPEREDVRPYLRIARLLHGLGLSAPDVRAADEAAGLLLLEDLGDETYTRVLASGGDEASLYTLATDVLIDLHHRFQMGSMAAGVPPYDDKKLMDEAALLVDWYLPAMRGEPASPTLRDEYLGLWQETFALARRAGLTLVLRDYHVDNLMLLDDREGVGACGLLDFQDAVIGPASYDLVSLLEDARRDVPADLAARMIARYLDAFPAMDRDGFMASYAVMGAQRSAKIVGIFTRLDRRDGKPIYLEHIPRVWRWLEGDLAHPVLVDLRNWFDREIPPAHRRIPDATGTA